MGTPGGEGVSRFRATAKAVNDPDFERLASGGGTFCKVTFVDRNNKGWEKTVEIKINYAGVSAAAHLVGQGAMAKNLKKIIAGYKSDTPAKIDINDPHVHDGNNVLFTAYMQLTQGYDMSEVVNAKPSQSFDAHLADLLEGRRKEITDSLKRTDPYNQVLDNANLDAAKKVFKTPATSDSGQDNTHRPPIAGGSSWPSTAQQPPTGRNSYAPPAGKNPPYPDETPPASSPLAPSRTWILPDVLMRWAPSILQSGTTAHCRWVRIPLRPTHTLVPPDVLMPWAPSILQCGTTAHCPPARIGWPAIRL